MGYCHALQPLPPCTTAAFAAMHSSHKVKMMISLFPYLLRAQSSRVQGSSSFGFGSGDRFSQLKPKDVQV